MSGAATASARNAHVGATACPVPGDSGDRRRHAAPSALSLARDGDHAPCRRTNRSSGADVPWRLSCPERANDMGQAFSGRSTACPPPRTQYRHSAPSESSADRTVNPRAVRPSRTIGKSSSSRLRNRPAWRFCSEGMIGQRSLQGRSSAAAIGRARTIPFPVDPHHRRRHDRRELVRWTAPSRGGQESRRRNSSSA
jgi:hypothetical protein